MFYPLFLLLALFLFPTDVSSHSVVSSSVHLRNCTVTHNGHVFKEGESVEIRGKLYKMEECALHRAYHACGANLLQMLSIACELLGQQKPKSGNGQRLRRFSRRKLLTEACCETLCTVSEMTRYCP